MTMLTLRRLRAMSGAIEAMLAGPVNEGDWPEDVTLGDMEAAADWVCEQIAKRESKAKRSPRS